MVINFCHGIIRNTDQSSLLTRCHGFLFPRMWKCLGIVSGAKILTVGGAITVAGRPSA